MSTLDEAGLPGVFQGFYAGEVQDPWRLASRIPGQQGPRGPAAVGIKLAVHHRDTVSFHAKNI
jgi:hypothetical protein